MRNLKPKIEINKFSGSGEGLLYYNEGFTSGNENGNSILNEGYSFRKLFDVGDEAFKKPFSVYSDLYNFIYVRKKYGSSSSDIYRLILGAGRIFCVWNNIGYSNQYNGVSLGYPASGDYYQISQKNYDLLELPSGNIIWSSENHLSLLVRGGCSSSSSTTKIVDKGGRNLYNLGVRIGQKVQNLQTGDIFTITSISNTSETNDTLNFTAGTKTNSVNDEWLCFIDTKWDLRTNKPQSMLGWVGGRRQIKQMSDKFYVLNDNFIACLMEDEETFHSGPVVGENKGKQLPIGYEGLSFDVNTDKMLVSALNSTNDSVLCLWDGYSDGWNNIIKFNSPISCIKTYKSGWIFISSGIVYFTNGFSIEKLSSYNDNEEIQRWQLEPTTFSSMEISKDIIYISSNSSNLNRFLPGVYALDLNSGWSYIPGVIKERQYYGCNSIKFNSSSNEVETTLLNGMIILRSGRNTSQYQYKSATWLINLKEESQIFGVGLNLSKYHDQYSNFGDGDEVNITVSIGDGKNEFCQYNGNIERLTAIDEFSIIKAYQDFNVGNQLVVIESSTGKIQGERTFIKEITEDGDNVIVKVDPPFSQVDNSYIMFLTYSVNKCDTKKILKKDFNREQLFFNPKPFFSNKLFVKIEIQGNNNSIPVSLMGINIY